MTPKKATTLESQCPTGRAARVQAREPEKGLGHVALFHQGCRHGLHDVVDDFDALAGRASRSESAPLCAKELLRDGAALAGAALRCALRPG